MSHQLTRRNSLKLGAAALLGGAMPSTTTAAKSASATWPAASAKRVILVYLQGGPPMQDMVDLKPKAPREIRGEFTPIQTSECGMHVCDLLPKLAKWMHRICVVRSVHHNAPCHVNMPMYTGHDVNIRDENARDSDPPSMGSVLAYLDDVRGVEHRVPPYVFVPCALGWGENRIKGGPHGGFLGHQYNPFSTVCDAYVDNPPDEDWAPQTVRGMPKLKDIHLQKGITQGRFETRFALLEHFGDIFEHEADVKSVTQYNQHKKLAHDLFTSRTVQETFDLSTESERVRQRYGKTLFGHSCLLGRRLVEAGSRFVNVSWDNMRALGVSKAAWDTHKNNFPMLKKTLLPDFDHSFTALLEDLQARELLDETLVVVMGEMGRTPHINKDGGRDHWTHCYSVMMAGGGIRGGMYYGESDKHAAYIKDKPVHIKDICATIYHCLGINPDLQVLDRTKRPIKIAHGGKPLLEVLGQG